MEHTYDHRDTCYRKHLDPIDLYHHHVHEEYEQQLDQYPMIPRKFVRLSENSKEYFETFAFVDEQTCIAADSMCLSFITSHLIMNEIDDIRTNRRTKNSW